MQFQQMNVYEIMFSKPTNVSLELQACQGQVAVHTTHNFTQIEQITEWDRAMDGFIIQELYNQEGILYVVVKGLTNLESSTSDEGSIYFLLNYQHFENSEYVRDVFLGQDGLIAAHFNADGELKI